MYIYIKDIDVERRKITIRTGKVDLDRVTILLESLVPKIQAHRQKFQELFNVDRHASLPGVTLPGALDRKFSSAKTRCECFRLFPAPYLSTDTASRIIRRRYFHPDTYTNALQRALREVGIEKRVTSHDFHNAFAAHLLESEKDFRTIQELLGHADVKTTEIYTHVAKGVGTTGIQSACDLMHRHK
jgi:integrase